MGNFKSLALMAIFFLSFTFFSLNSTNPTEIYGNSVEHELYEVNYAPANEARLFRGLVKAVRKAAKAVGRAAKKVVNATKKVVNVTKEVTKTSKKFVTRLTQTQNTMHTDSGYTRFEHFGYMKSINTSSKNIETIKEIKFKSLD